MTPKRAVAWTAEAGLIAAVARIGRAEQAEIARIDAVFHQRLDAEYGVDEEAWPGSARYAYVSTVAAIHHQHQRKAA
jgi:hypothetical protein